MPEPAVLSAYRRILRASARGAKGEREEVRVLSFPSFSTSAQPPSLSPLLAAFRGDAHALAAARSEIRSHYLAAADASPSDIPSKVADSDEAASFLGAHVVQGVLNERGNYKVTLEPHHADGASLVEPQVAVVEEKGGGGCGKK